MPDGSFYTVGGTVQASGGLYITRKADEELLQYCRKGEFAFVLTTRQVGKSSLVVNTAERLADEGFLPITLDLSGIGREVTAEQWYLGLLTAIEDDLLATNDNLTLTIDVIQWWQEQASLGVTQRLNNYFEDVLLKEIEGQIVIFIDEIDTTLGLNFTDDFFIAIRYLYNNRSRNPDLNRLSFVLIGVAEPGDLIHDRQRTPFNIGRRVNLTDFSVEEARPLADGLGLSKREAWELLGWIHEWTQGHPYLTQRLCQAVAQQNRDKWTKDEVRRTVAKTFLGARSSDDRNLQFVRAMLTEHAPDPVGVLKTYETIRCKRLQTVNDEEQSIIKSHLKLAGVVRNVDGELKVRNPIYTAVFDCGWVKEHRPPRYWTQEWQRLALATIGGLIILSLILLGFFAQAQTKARKTAEAAGTNEAYARETAEAAGTIEANSAATAVAALAEAGLANQRLGKSYENTREIAEEQATRIAFLNLANQVHLLTTHSQYLLEEAPDLSLLLAIESIQVMRNVGESPLPISYEILYDLGILESPELPPSTLSSEVLDRACEQAGRNFSQAEWERFFGEKPYRRTCKFAVSVGER